MGINFKGEDLESGLIDWVKAEIKETPKIAYDLGKFFFTVSTVTIGLIAALERLNDKIAFDSPMVLSIFFLFVSMIISLDLARPREIRIDGSSDLQIVYHNQIKKVTWRIFIWFTLWLVGVCCGGYAVVFSGSS